MLLVLIAFVLAIEILIIVFFRFTKRRAEAGDEVALEWTKHSHKKL